jgi:hypothetical protein
MDRSTVAKSLQSRNNRELDHYTKLSLTATSIRRALQPLRYVFPVHPEFFRNLFAEEKKIQFRQI